MDWIVKYRQFRRHGCLKIDLGFGQCCAGGRCHQTNYVELLILSPRDIYCGVVVVFIVFNLQIASKWNALSGCRTLKINRRDATDTTYYLVLCWCPDILLPSLTISYHLLPEIMISIDFYRFLMSRWGPCQASRNCSHELHEVLQAHRQVPGVACDLHTFSTACHPCVAEQKHQRMSVTQSFHRAKACLQGSFGARTYGQAPWKCMNSRKSCILVCSKINGSSAHIVHDFRENR